MRKARRMAGVCVLCLPLVGVAAPAPGAIEIETTLAGCWTGVLQYRDYPSDRLFDIPLSTKIRAIADGHTFVRESRFDDRPRRQVYITALTQFSAEGDRVAFASSRLGEPIEVTSDAVSVTRLDDATHWAEVYTRTGLDDEKPSDITVEVTRDGDTLTTEKRVRNLDDPSKTVRLRNRTVLKRLPGCGE